MISAIEGLLLTDARSEMIQRVHSNHEKNQLTMKVAFWVQMEHFVGFSENVILDKMWYKFNYRSGVTLVLQISTRAKIYFVKYFMILIFVSHPVHHPCMSNIGILCVAVYTCTTMSCTHVCPIFGSTHATLGPWYAKVRRHARPDTRS